MGSPITFSGFNKIDFNLILNAIIEQERVPIRTLQTQQQTLQSQAGAFGTLASKLGAVESAATTLAELAAFGGRAVSNTDATALTVAAGGTAAIGTFDIVVNELARAQVTGSTSAHADKNATTVATGGSLTIGGVAVSVTGAVTLEGLASAINATDGIGVTATIVSPASGSYQLVLTGKDTGAASAFTITNNLTGGSGVGFADQDLDGISGDSEADNAVQASDASAVVNNITVTGATNVLDSAIPGATLTLLKKDPATTHTVTITGDLGYTKGLVRSFISAYNDLTSFLRSQTDAAARGESANIGRDGVLRSLQFTLSNTLNSRYQVGGSYDYAAQVGITFSRTGELSFDEAAFDAAVTNGTADAEKLFLGGNGQDGVFTMLVDAIKEYTQAGGLVPDAQSRLNDQVSRLSNRITDYEERLAVRRAALQQEFIAADLAMTRLNQQVASLSSIGGQFSAF